MEHSHLDIFYGVAIPYFNFFLFVGVFVFFFRKPLSAMARARREQHLAASRDAAKALDAAREQFQAIKTKFDNLDAELAAFKKQSEEQASEEAKRLVSEGERLSQQILSETKKLAAEEIGRARRELRDEIVAAAKERAEEKITKSLGEAEKAKILSSRIGDLGTYKV